ncbi:hypothetical protein Dsin_027935 [Dipteronia sinensis]|uniref:Uncharacterized protein n=1 Tax=Dipteronia sinensis TaxID=43782 RepID=A0AAD9ZPT8_9ROSI|nr:hypothetical protein Dsin_027935 [Dipteronia sinensis]
MQRLPIQPSVSFQGVAREGKEVELFHQVVTLGTRLLISTATQQRKHQHHHNLHQNLSRQHHKKDKYLLLLYRLPIQYPRKGSCLNATERYIRKFKRQKTDTSKDRTQDGNMIEVKWSLQRQQSMKDAFARRCKSRGPASQLDETQFLHFDKLKDGESAVDCDDTDETDDCYEEDHDTSADLKNKEINENVISSNIELKEQLHDQEGFDPEMLPCSDKFFYNQNESIVPNASQVTNGDLNKQEAKEDIKIGEYKQPEVLISWKEICHTGTGSILANKKPSKVAFCPKEVKRMLESEPLLLKNYQSHTIRKIIVFASLGIRHGCEDIYELDFSHFSILRKGESYVSSENPGEHVLYENPGVRRKVFYPNRQNPTLCPLQILEEENAMRPSDSSFLSCLFLCIKYGGRTRNLRQNEYVRQRMGRNKLKSFGPVMCRMAMLVRVRSGSFFFKALGITLLFMAGFPDDLVQREIKYRNFRFATKILQVHKAKDILDMYFIEWHCILDMTDEDAEREELFLPHLTNPDTFLNLQLSHSFSSSVLVFSS